MRFDKELIQLLSNSERWLKTLEELESSEELFHIDFVADRARSVEMLKQLIAGV